MNLRSLAPAELQELLGYLNFSSGAPDSGFQHRLNDVFGLIERQLPHLPPWQVLKDALAEQLSHLQGGSEAFSEATQARAVLELSLDQVLAAYRQYHHDLLHHQPDEALFQPLFLARVCEAVLRQGPPWEESERIVEATLAELNDFLGYRPVAVLNTPQKIEPYPHEWVAALPLYIAGAGVVTGRYHELIEQALAILRDVPPEILRQAWFDPELMDELALDPRAYDFDHPVSKRPNHQFGQWDPHRLDNQGRFRRFVLQGVTLDAIWQRTQESSEIPADQRLFEAGAVLAGVILMAAALGGSGPDTHDSTTTLATLLPRIAKFRDAFYERLLASRTGQHGERLRAEAANLHQPFGGARQHLNHRLARLRAVQLQHVHLAQLFARMGYLDASSRQSEIVPVTSARMICEIHGRITAGHYALDHGQLSRAGELLPVIEDLLHRAIDCGALVDPWNILGFQGQFSLFPAMENSVRDHRVDVLVHLVREIFGLYARLEGESAAAGDKTAQRRASTSLAELNHWWDRFASIEVSGVERLSGREVADSARHVAIALGAWHEAGEAAGDITFWRQHVARFNSPKTYALVIEALLQKRDFVAARALLIQWLSQSEQIPLDEGTYSFHELSVHWLTRLHARDERSGLPADHKPLSDLDRWTLTRKFFDYLEANADTWWEVPRFEWERAAQTGSAAAGEVDEDDDEHKYSAAYDEMTYRDSTSDGHEGDTLESGPTPTQFELDAEAARLGKRMAFLATLARLWRTAAARTPASCRPPERNEVLQSWFQQAMTNRRRLLELLETVAGHPLPTPTGAHDSLVEYDRRRLLKESLLARIIGTAVETAAAGRRVRSAMDNPVEPAGLPPWEQQAVLALHAMLRGDAASVRAAFPALREALEQQPVLYVPLAKNGNPRRIAAAQDIQQLLVTMLRGLPRLGLLSEACQLIVTIQTMEKHRPEGDGVVTEFDRLFEVGYLSIVECLIATADQDTAADTSDGGADTELVDSLQLLTESLLKRWLDHSKSLRLSVLEKITDKTRWQSLVQFTELYGHDLFTPRFLNVGNLRAILHQGVDAYLHQLAEEGVELKLLEDLSGSLPRQTAVEQLSLIIEAIVENYSEYKDFNSTTTQSDRGELTYILLDFLRIKASYERVAWNIRPVVMAHEVLVRRGKLAAAELWRRALAQRTSEVADWHLRRLAELTKQYGVRLPTIADRLQERFVRPLAIDRIRALVKPSIEDLRGGTGTASFELLEQEINEFTEHPTGAGLDVPTWLLALEQEADRFSARRGFDRDSDDQAICLQVRLSWEEVQSQLRGWEAGG